MAKFTVNLIGHDNADVVTVETDNDDIGRSAIAINAGRYYYYESFVQSPKPSTVPHVVTFREADVCRLDAKTPA